MILEQQLLQTFRLVRKKTEELCTPLAVEDYVMQSIDDVSPPKWHLAHTTWFFETFILLANVKNYKSFNPLFAHLFDSYNQTENKPYPRIRRGVMSRPSVETIYSYRKYVDQHMLDFLDRLSETKWQRIEPVLKLCLNHEQQHQELLLMDIKHNLSCELGYPAYRARVVKPLIESISPLKFVEMPGGLVAIGNANEQFCFDNETPRHQVNLLSYELATRLVTNAEYCEFIEAGGYQQQEYWTDEGWQCKRSNAWCAPNYWLQLEKKWYVFSLSGLREIELSEPVSHVSYYEADAFARWKNCRLPTEVEWENVVTQNNFSPEQGNFLEENIYHPSSVSLTEEKQPQQMFGDLWEWTSSLYAAYPGYQSPKTIFGKYNGEFLPNQFVLRGGCCSTPKSHIRATYRNFFQPDKRWIFSGIRLAK